MYNYKYEMFLTIVSNLSFPKNIQELLKEPIEKFNLASSKSGVNVKHLSFISKVNEKLIKLELESNKEIKIPGKAIRFFTQTIRNSHIMDQYFNESGKLFRTLNLDIDKNNEIIDPNDISDIDFINDLNKFIYEKTSLYNAGDLEKQRALESMKILALKSGILKQ